VTARRPIVRSDIFGRNGVDSLVTIVDYAARTACVELDVTDRYTEGKVTRGRVYAVTISLGDDGAPQAITAVQYHTPSGWSAPMSHSDVVVIAGILTMVLEPTPLSALAGLPVKRPEAWC
jgi:hypothetical protein